MGWWVCGWELGSEGFEVAFDVLLGVWRRYMGWNVYLLAWCWARRCGWMDARQDMNAGFCMQDQRKMHWLSLEPRDKLILKDCGMIGRVSILLDKRLL